ncbi:MAG: acyl-CoA dehydrogenase [Syntrophales bacterium]|jgi:alkylation response protein AidB-like acyl-CoA dehydrogenase
MSNLLVNTRDQQFVLHEQLGIENIFKAKYADYAKELVDMMLSQAERLAIDVILPTYVDGDREGCTFKDGKVSVPKSFHAAYKKFVGAGWQCAIKDPEVGGQGMPISVSTACFELFQAANYPLLMYPLLTTGAASLIERFGTEEQKNKYMYKMFAGEWGGTMCLTESGAGTDVGALKTTAKKLPDGRYSITGTKIFISGGDHDLCQNIVHPVLARIEGDVPGTKGISIFIVPKYRVNDDGSMGEFNDVRTGNIEHKMGIKGSATCTINFGDDGKCIGELLGKERAGMAIMFQMMNDARLEVGIQALGVATAAYEHAVAYAKERIQGVAIWDMKNPDAKPVPIIQHPDVKRTLLWMKAHVEGIRVLLYYTAYCFDMADISETKIEKSKWQGLAELLIPICKAYSSDKAMQVCSKAIDVYGGYGYCSEYPVEQYMRDCKITTIYEGTNAVQALDLVGRKLAQRRGEFMMSLYSEVYSVITRSKGFEDLTVPCNYLEESLKAFSDLTTHFYRLGRGASFLIPVLNASPYLELFGDVAVGSLLMQAATIANEKLNTIYTENDAKGSKARQRALIHKNKDVAFYNGKIAAAKFFALNILSTVKARCEAIKVGDRTPIEMAEELFTI